MTNDDIDNYVRFQHLTWKYGTRSPQVKDFLASHESDKRLVAFLRAVASLMEIMRPGIVGPKRWWQTWRW